MEKFKHGVPTHDPDNWRAYHDFSMQLKKFLFSEKNPSFFHISSPSCSQMGKKNLTGALRPDIIFWCLIRFLNGSNFSEISAGVPHFFPIFAAYHWFSDRIKYVSTCPKRKIPAWFSPFDTIVQYFPGYLTFSTVRGQTLSVVFYITLSINRESHLEFSSKWAAPYTS